MDTLSQMLEDYRNGERGLPSYDELVALVAPQVIADDCYAPSLDDVASRDFNHNVRRASHLDDYILDQAWLRFGMTDRVGVAAFVAEVRRLDAQYLHTAAPVQAQEQWIDKLTYDAQVDEWAIEKGNLEREIEELKFRSKVQSVAADYSALRGQWAEVDKELGAKAMHVASFDDGVNVSTQPMAAPAGWKLVPLVATQEMLEKNNYKHEVPCGYENVGIDDSILPEIWASMVADSPAALVERGDIKELTDAQILNAVREHFMDGDGGYMVDTAPECVIAGVRAAIATKEQSC